MKQHAGARRRRCSGCRRPARPTRAGASSASSRPGARRSIGTASRERRKAGEIGELAPATISERTRRPLPAPRHALDPGRDADRRARRDRARVRAADDGLDAVRDPSRGGQRARGAARPRRRRDHPLLPRRAEDAHDRGRAQPDRDRRLPPVVPPARDVAAPRGARDGRRRVRRRSGARAAAPTCSASISTTTRRPARCSTAPRSTATAARVLGRRRRDDGQPVRPRRQLRAQRRAHRRRPSARSGAHACSRRAKATPIVSR